MITIPLLDQNDFLIEAELQGISYILHFAWNSEAGYWVMTVESTENEPVLAGVVLSPNTPLLKSFHHLAIPRGEFVAHADDATLQRIGREDFFTGKATLYYLTEDEYASL